MSASILPSPSPCQTVHCCPAHRVPKMNFTSMEAKSHQHRVAKHCGVADDTSAILLIYQTITHTSHLKIEFFQWRGWRCGRCSRFRWCASSGVRLPLALVRCRLPRLLLATPTLVLATTASILDRAWHPQSSKFHELSAREEMTHVCRGVQAGLRVTEVTEQR